MQSHAKNPINRDEGKPGRRSGSTEKETLAVN